MDPVGAANSGRTRTDRFYNTLPVVYFYEVANPDGAFCHQDPATDEIVDDVLGPETHTDGDGTSRESECSQRYAEKTQGSKANDYQRHDEEDAFDNVSDVRSHLRLAHAPSQQEYNEATAVIAGH